jgi:hypothetical protein
MKGLATFTFGILLGVFGQLANADPLRPLPDAPKPAPTLREFLHDKKQMVASSVALGVKSVDLGQTVWHRENDFNFHEKWLPAQNSPMIAVDLLSSQAGVTYLQYCLYKRKHGRLALVTQFISTGVSAVAIFNSFNHVTMMPSPATATARASQKDLRKR